MILHIAERFVIHFLCSGILVVAVSYALRHWTRNNAKARTWIAPERERLLVISALIVAGIAAWREPFDVSAGGSVIKSVCDFASWYLGAGVSAWALYRWWKE
jgi:hypothetical protein